MHCAICVQGQAISATRTPGMLALLLPGLTSTHYKLYSNLLHTQHNPFRRGSPPVWARQCGTPSRTSSTDNTLRAHSTGHLHAEHDPLNGWVHIDPTPLPQQVGCSAHGEKALHHHSPHPGMVQDALLRATSLSLQQTPLV